jgi:hypothetical protein
MLGFGSSLRSLENFGDRSLLAAMGLLRGRLSLVVFSLDI